MKHLWQTIPLALMVFLPFQNIFAQAPTSTINETSLSAPLQFLSSAWFEGRKTGERGNEMAAEYLCSIFREIGLKPVQWKEKERVHPAYSKGWNESFFQKVPLFKYQTEPMKPVRVLTGAGSGQEVAEFDMRSDFIYTHWFTSQNVNLKIPIVLAGYGIHDSLTGYNDFKGIDVKGKAVVVLVGIPGFQDTLSHAYQRTGKKISPHGLVFSKFNALRKAGAASILFYNSISNWYSSIYIDNLGYDLNTTNEHKEALLEPAMDSVDKEVPVMIISSVMLKEILNGTGTDIVKYENEIAQSGKANPVILVNKEIEINIRKNKELIFPKNLLGMIPGRKSDEYVIVGAHYDHVGKKGEDIFYGADDNASGVSAVLAIARACKEMNIQPEKTILFALWTGEEEGLLGSEYFAKKWNNGKIDAYFNFDMVGRYSAGDSANYLTIYHSDNFQAVKTPINNINIADSLNLNIVYCSDEDEIPDSDQDPFAAREIPFCWFFTGFHPDYHSKTDTYWEINVPALTRIATLGFRAIWEKANEQ